MSVTNRIVHIDREREHIPPSAGSGHADTASTPHRSSADADGQTRLIISSHDMRCRGIGEMPSPNQQAEQAGGSSHGDDTDSDGASLTGPQPSLGDKTVVPPGCLWLLESAG